MSMDAAAMRRLLEANGAVAQPNVPKPPQSYTPPSQSYGVPQSSSVPAPPQPSRWNADASYQDRLSHFGSDGNDARSEILAVKDLYNNEMKGGASADRLGQIYGWNQQVRKAAGISEDDYTYGNGVDNRGRSETPVPPPPGAAPVAASSGASFVPPPPTQNIPVPPNNYPTMDTAKAREYAKAQVAAKIRELQLSSDNALRRGQTSADQQLAGMESQYSKLKTNIGQDRSIQDVSNARNLSPFSGRSDYAQGMLTQERARSDREMNDQYMTNQNNVNQNVGNLREQLNQSMIALQNAAPDQEEQLYQEVIKNERNYQLALQGELRSDALANGQLNDSSFNRSLGSFNANLAAQNQQFNQGIQQGQLTGNYQGAPTLAGQQLGQQQKQSNWQAYMDSVGLTGNMGSGPKQDWGLLGGTNGAPSYQAQQDQLSQKNIEDEKTFRRQRASAEDQQWLANYERQGQQFAASQGLQWAELSQRQQEHAADMAFKQQAYQDEQKQTTQKQQAAQTQKMQTEKQGLVNAIRTGQMTALQAKKQIEEDAKLGFYSPAEAKDMLDSLSTLAGISGVPNLNPQFPK